MSPTVRIARANFALGQVADLFTRRIRRRHLSVIAVASTSTNGHLPEHFRQLPGLRPYDREAAR